MKTRVLFILAVAVIVAALLALGISFGILEIHLPRDPYEKIHGAGDPS